jgi:hypothetical protein
MRGFDFEVVLKSGLSTIFSGADKRDLELVTDYFKKGDVEVKTINEMAHLNAELGSEGEDDGSIVDEEEGEGEGEEEDDDDFIAPDEDKAGEDDWEGDDSASDE